MIVERLRRILICLRASRIGPSEQEGSERTTARERGYAWNACTQEAVAGNAGYVLLAEPIGALAFKRISEFEVVFPARIVQVVFDRPHRLFRSVLGNAAPACEFGESSLGEGHSAVDHILHAEFAPPSRPLIG